MILSRRRFFGSLAGAAAVPVATIAKAALDAPAGETQFQRLYECWNEGPLTGDSRDLRVTVEAVVRGKAEFIIKDDNSAFLLDELAGDARSRFVQSPPQRLPWADLQVPALPGGDP